MKRKKRHIKKEMQRIKKEADTDTLMIGDFSACTPQGALMVNVTRTRG